MMVSVWSALNKAMANGDEGRVRRKAKVAISTTPIAPQSHGVRQSFMASFL